MLGADIVVSKVSEFDAVITRVPGHDPVKGRWAFALQSIPEATQDSRDGITIDFIGPILGLCNGSPDMHI